MKKVIALLFSCLVLLVAAWTIAQAVHQLRHPLQADAANDDELRFARSNRRGIRSE